MSDRQLKVQILLSTFDLTLHPNGDNGVGNIDYLFKSDEQTLHIDGDFEISTVNGIVKKRPIFKDGTVLLADGPDGKTFKKKPGILDQANNFLIFQCKHCGITSTATEKSHTLGCAHPWANIN